MKYSVLTVASKSYFPFLDIFLRSLFANCDARKIDKVYVVDVGLGEYKEELIKSKKIVFIDSNCQDNFSGVHSDGWYNTTKLKTHYLKQILSTAKNESVVIIDCDTLIMHDIATIVDTNYDIQITKVSAGVHRSASGVDVTHIACFMVFNNIPKSIAFVDQWIRNIDFLLKQGKPKPHETPAMNQAMKSQHGCSMQSISDRISCSDLAIYPETKIIHFKSSGPDKTSPCKNIEKRFSLKCYSKEHENYDFNRYLNAQAYNKWLKDFQ